MKKVFSSNSELIHIWANNDDTSVFKRANSVSCQYDRLKSFKLGHYSVNKIDKAALYIGCHTIPFNEIENIASQLHLAA